MFIYYLSLIYSSLNFSNITAKYCKSALFQDDPTFVNPVPKFITAWEASAKYTPNLFKSVILSDREQSSFTYDSNKKRWVLGYQTENLDYYSYSKYTDKMNADLVKKQA